MTAKTGLAPTVPSPLTLHPEAAITPKDDNITAERLDRLFEAIFEEDEDESDLIFVLEGLNSLRGRCAESLREEPPPWLVEHANALYTREKEPVLSQEAEDLAEKANLYAMHLGEERASMLFHCEPTCSQTQNYVRILPMTPLAAPHTHPCIPPAKTSEALMLQSVLHGLFAIQAVEMSSPRLRGATKRRQSLKPEEAVKWGVVKP